MFNEKIIKIVNKHKVITNDKPLPYHVSYYAVFLYCGSFYGTSYDDSLDALRLSLKGYQIK